MINQKKLGLHLLLPPATAGTTLLVSLLSASCSAPVEDADTDELGQIYSAIENGELRPSSLNGGTAIIEVYGPTGLRETCSGQVVARDSILTAAHCLYNVGLYSDGWSKTKTVNVTIQHQDPNGSWTALSAPRESVKAFVRKDYVTYADASDKRSLGWDIAVLRRSIPYGNLVSSDVTALVTGPTDEMDSMYVYGHGYSTDTDWDKQLRRGYFDTLTWDRNSSSELYRTVRSDTLADDAHTCAHDSGSPWKVWGYPYPGSPPTSGVQFGVHVSGTGWYACAEENARAAMISYLDHWVRDRILDGNYASCQDTSHQVFTGTAWEWVDTRTCW